MYITDDELVRRIVQKEQSAFEELIKRYKGLITTIVNYHLNSISVWQEDCINDILFAIWQNIDRYDSEKNTLKNWIGAVSKYRAINYKRKFYRDFIAGELDEDIADGIEIDTELIRLELEDEIQSLLSALKPVDKEIFIQHYILEVPIQNISENLDKKPSWIYNRISRGRKMLRKLYVKRGKDYYEK